MLKNLTITCRNYVLHSMKFFLNDCDGSFWGEMLNQIIFTWHPRLYWDQNCLNKRRKVHIFLFKLTGKGDVFSLAGVKAISQHIQIWSKILCASLFAEVAKTALVTSSSTFYFIRRTGVLIQKLWNRSVEIPFILEVLLIKCINLKKLIYTAIKVFAKREDLWR